MADEAEQAPDPLAQLAADEAAAREAAAAAEEGEAPADAEATPPPEAEPERLYAGRYKSVEELESAVKEKDRFISQQGNEIGSYRQQLDQYNQLAAQYPQQQGQPQQQDGFTRDQLDEMYAEDPLGTTIYLQEMAAQRAMEAWQQQNAPMFQQMNNVVAANAVEQLKQEVGNDVLNENIDALRGAIESDREYFGPPEVRLQRMKQAVYAAAYERTLQSGGQRPRNDRGQYVSQQGDVHVEGGSGAQPVPQPGEKLTPEEQELANLQTWRRPVDEKGIPLPLG
jgi:hypothetical protein